MCIPRCPSGSVISGDSEYSCNNFCPEGTGINKYRLYYSLTD